MRWPLVWRRGRSSCDIFDSKLEERRRRFAREEGDGEFVLEIRVRRLVLERAVDRSSEIGVRGDENEDEFTLQHGVQEELALYDETLGADTRAMRDDEDGNTERSLSRKVVGVFESGNCTAGNVYP
jgi:hypothetical protein